MLTADTCRTCGGRRTLNPNCGTGVEKPFDEMKFCGVFFQRKKI